MARNVGKKRGAQPRPAAGGGSGGKKSLVAFVGGLVVGLAIAGGVYLLKILPGAMEIRERELACDEAGGAPTGDKVDAGDAADAADAAADKKPVTFDFYNMLTKQQTIAPVPGSNTTRATTPPPVSAVVPAAVPPPIPPAPATAAAVPPSATAPAAAANPVSAPVDVAPPPAARPEARYSLQAGSFATRAEADRRRGELLLSGLDASVLQVTTDKGDIRFRVIAGPFGDEAAMKKAQQQLAGRKIDTLPVRLK